MNLFTGLDFPPLYHGAATLLGQAGAAAAGRTPGLPASSADLGAGTLWSVLVSGGVFMLPLAALLFLATLLIFIYLLTLRRASVVSRRYLEICEALLRKRDYLGLLAVSNRHGEAVARVVQAMLAFAKDNPTATLTNVREIAETEGVRQASSLNHRITYLADVGTIAPMVGLLGTVSGMIHSFGALATDIATSKPMMLAQGVSEALVCTASGLVVGIVAFTGYAYFRGRVQRLTADLEAAATQILAVFSLYYSAAGGTGSQASGRRRERETAALEEDF
jgi:biopolymer transport protein ExbB